MANVSSKVSIAVTSVIGAPIIAAFIYAGVDWVVNTKDPVEDISSCQVTYVDDMEEEKEDYIDMLGYNDTQEEAVEIVPSDFSNEVVENENIEPVDFPQDRYYTKDAYNYALEEQALPLYNSVTGQLDMKSPDLALIEHYQEAVEAVEEKSATNDWVGVQNDALKIYQETTAFLFHNAPLTEYDITRSMLTEEAYTEVLADCVLIDSMAMDYSSSYKQEVIEANEEDYIFYQQAAAEVQDQIIQMVGEHAYSVVVQEDGMTR